VQRRAQALAKEITTAAQQQVHTGVETLQREALDAGAELSARSEKLGEALQRRLVETHDGQCREIERIQADTTAQTSHLLSEVADLNRRISSLNESVRRLETDLDAHLDRVAGEIVADARIQLDTAVAIALKELQTRGSNEVESRVDEACGHLRTIQNRIEESFSGSLQSQGDDAAQVVAHRFEELAQTTVEKWRQALARDLSSVAKSLGQQLHREAEGQID